MDEPFEPKAADAAERRLGASAGQHDLVPDPTGVHEIERPLERGYESIIWLDPEIADELEPDRIRSRTHGPQLICLRTKQV